MGKNRIAGWVGLLSTALLPCVSSGNSGELEKAEDLRDKGLYVQSVNKCESILRKKLSTAERKNAMLALAAAYLFNTRDHTYPEAVKTYNEFLRKYPDDPRNPMIWFHIGRAFDCFSLNRSRDIFKARAAYKKCFENYPKSKWASQAHFWYAQSFIFNLNKENATKAVKIFKNMEKLYPDTPILGSVYSQISELACTYLNDYATAVKYSEKAISYGIFSSDLKRLHLYRTAYLYDKRLNNPKKAIKWYKALTKNSPTQSDPNYFLALKRIKAIRKATGGGK